MVKEKLYNLLVQHSLYTFAVIHADNNCVKILHSMGRYVEPLGGESIDPNHNQFFVFKGGCAGRNDLPLVAFKATFVQSIVAKFRQIDEVVKYYYEEGAVSLILIDSDDEDMALEKLVLIPNKWAAEVIDLHLSPTNFWEFIQSEMDKWSQEGEAKAYYLVN